MRHRRAMAARVRAMAEGASTPGRVPTPDGWVTLDGGGIVPAESARPTGWGDDRDAVNAARITTARAAMASKAEAYRQARVDMADDSNGDMLDRWVATIGAADALFKAWVEYTEATS